jgi:hypothetical protein
VRAILDNPRYTGYAVLGRYSKHETLLDPDDVAAGNVVRFRKSAKDTVGRSRRPAHPAIVSVATFTQAQLLRRSRASGGLSAARKLERGAKDTKHVYLFRGGFAAASVSAGWRAHPARAYLLPLRCSKHRSRLARAGRSPQERLLT